MRKYCFPIPLNRAWSSSLGEYYTCNSSIQIINGHNHPALVKRRINQYNYWYWCFLCIFQKKFEINKIQQISQFFFFFTLKCIMYWVQVRRSMLVFWIIYHHGSMFLHSCVFCVCYIWLILILNNNLFFFYGYISKIVFSSVQLAN